MTWLAPLIEALVTALATVVINSLKKKEDPSEKVSPCPEAQAQTKISHKRKRRSNKRT